MIGDELKRILTRIGYLTEEREVSLDEVSGWLGSLWGTRISVLHDTGKGYVAYVKGDVKKGYVYDVNGKYALFPDERTALEEGIINVLKLMIANGEFYL